MTGSPHTLYCIAFEFADPIFCLQMQMPGLFLHEKSGWDSFKLRPPTPQASVKVLRACEDDVEEAMLTSKLVLQDGAAIPC